jgi:hypothetical protein
VSSGVTARGRGTRQGCSRPCADSRVPRRWRRTARLTDALLTAAPAPWTPRRPAPALLGRSCPDLAGPATIPGSLLPTLRHARHAARPRRHPLPPTTAPPATVLAAACCCWAAWPPQRRDCSAPRVVGSSAKHLLRASAAGLSWRVPWGSVLMCFNSCPQLCGLAGPLEHHRHSTLRQCSQGFALQRNCARRPVARMALQHAAACEPQPACCRRYGLASCWARLLWGRCTLTDAHYV